MKPAINLVHKLIIAKKKNNNIIIIIIIIIIITILNGLAKVARHYNNKIFNAVFLYGGFLPRL